jgi:N-acylneuraminate cytidylyltransferase
VIEGRSVLAVITARGGSKGLPGKNLRALRGRPLIAWSIEAARQSRVVDRLILSSDDADIILAARELGCEAPFIRNPRLSGDDASSVDVVLDALDRVPGCDLVVLLQPTSPLRAAADIDGTLQRMEQAGAPACVSICPAPSHPWLTFAQDGEGRLDPFAGPPPGASLRRQDLPPAWVLNGAVYAADAAWLRREQTFVRPGQTAAWEMPLERSVDIDTLEDFRAAERLAGG